MIAILRRGSGADIEKVPVLEGRHCVLQRNNGAPLPETGCPGKVDRVRSP
jgi:hypothetical protein